MLLSFTLKSNTYKILQLNVLLEAELSSHNLRSINYIGNTISLENML